MKGIVKQFPGVLANDHVDFELKKGEIHGVLGENGTGKTTLMNILYGLVRPDEGEILLYGQRQNIETPNHALKLGIGMVHQHFMLVKPFSVASNIVLGMRDKTGMHFNEAKAQKLVTEFYERTNCFKVDPKLIVEDLPVGIQQRVEILKALFRGAKILILDEPTAVLTPQESKELFDILRKLKDDGYSIIFISHKLHEVMDLTQRITVMRSGKVVGTVNTSNTSQQELAKMMVGRNVIFNFKKATSKPGRSILTVKDLVVEKDKVSVVKGISFEVKAGEILGIAGVDGNGQKELIEAIVGLRKLASGKIELNGKEISNQGIVTFIENGGAYIPEDRQEVGLVLEFDVKDNLVLKSHVRLPFSKYGVLNINNIKQNAEELIKKYQIKVPTSETKVKTLSGGNQQKVVVARELSGEPELLVAVNPTRGVDIGATEYIRQNLLAQRDAGKAILLVSTELDEILAISDRVVVIYEGSLMGEVTSEVSREIIGLMMAGTKQKDIPELQEVV
jgi:ABC-type uncharacterized transport system ATPase subunit